MRTLSVVFLCAALGCADEGDLVPMREAANVNEEAQLALAKRLRDVELAMREVQEAQTTGAPAADAIPTREIDGVPLVPAIQLRDDEAPYRVHVTRNGVAAAIPGSKPPVRDQTNCGWHLERPALRYGSDLILNRSKMGRSSPYLLLENGTPLQPHAANEAHANRCAGAYRHAGARFEFSPTGYPEAATERTYSLEYDPRLAVPRADGRKLYWVYPGTELVFTFDGQWPDADAAPELLASVKRVGQYKGRASYQIDWAKPKWIRGATPVIRSDQMPSTGTVRFAINSPVDGPLVVIDTLLIGTSDKAFVVTAEGYPTLLGGEE